MLEENKMEIVEEKSIKNTYVCLRNVSINEESYETKLLLEESISNVIKFHILYEASERYLSYDVSKTISLDEYLKANKLAKVDICDILDSIDGLLSSIENYLISENSVALDTRLIRVERGIGKRIHLKFIVIPNFTSDFSYELSKLLIRLLRHIDVNDKDALTLAYSLFVRSSKDNYTINDLMEIIDSVREKNNNSYGGIDAESLNAYDEETVSEMISDGLKNEDISVEETEYDEVQDNVNKGDSLIEKEGLIVDDEFKKSINDDLFDSFDNNVNNDAKELNKKDKKVIKFKKKIFDLSKSKTLNAHIIIKFWHNAIIPILCLLPALIYQMYGMGIILKYVAAIVLYEMVLIVLFVVNRIRNKTW